MPIIKDYRGRECQLSEETYTVVGFPDPPPYLFPTSYKSGDTVRLIKPPDSKSPLGHHDLPGWATISIEGAHRAQFCGIERKYLQPNQ